MLTDLPALARARALMLGSLDFPPTDHLAYLRRQGPQVGGGIGRHAVADLVLRDVALPAEQTEVIRVVSETLIAHAPDPAQLTRAPAGLLAVALRWFGLERAGHLVGLHCGFFWDEALWIRGFYAVLGDAYPWDVHFEIESHLYGALWADGMRETMIQIPVGTPNLAARRAAGWVDSHEVHFAHNPRPFMWLRKRFARRPVRADMFPGDPAWQVTT